jgi:cyanophycinase
VSFSSVDAVTEGQPICILGLIVHVLTAGANFNLHTRQASSSALTQLRE